MKRYEKDIILGTSLTFIGVWLLYSISLSLIAGWLIIIIGKIMIFMGIFEYRDFKRALRGDDLNKDSKLIKKIRKIIRKRYS